MSRDNSRLVYSSEAGRICTACRQPEKDCRCGSRQAGAGGDGVVRIGRQTKGRKGKGVTLMSGVPLAGGELKRLAKELKQKCGTGGTVKDGIIEIQGDHRDLLVELLTAKGWPVKKSGG